MAQLLAPYNNAMRLGQGFNSFTHELCLIDAVGPPSPDLKANAVDGKEHPSISSVTPAPAPVPEGKPSLPSDTLAPIKQTGDDADDKDVAQTVSYSTRFVEKISEVVDSMNISAALSISTNTIGGSANGQFIDSDKFKQSDINFFVQVRVTNQTHNDTNLTQLNLVPPVTKPPASADDKYVEIENQKFLEVYGVSSTAFQKPLATPRSDMSQDTFISGWEEGGELNALISVRVLNKSKVHSIKASLEGQLGTPALTAKVSGKLSIEQTNNLSETETTVTVNWSGGGEIKQRDALWDVNSLTLAAANFPVAVKYTPQRIYAILTKYTALSEFQKRIKDYSLLDYDIASVYTSSLLDTYVDYKVIWKSLQIAASDLDARRITVKPAQLAEITKKFLQGSESKSDSKTGKVGSDNASQSSQISSIESTQGSVSSLVNVTSQEHGQRKKGSQHVALPKLQAAYEANMMGLLQAKTDCRLLMVRIVKEIDALKKSPALALKPDAGDIMPSQIFRQLLPIAVPDQPTDAESNQLGLGTASPEDYKLSTHSFTTYAEAEASMKRNAAKAQHYLMSDWSGAVSPESSCEFKNDLDTVKPGIPVQSIWLFWNNDYITGIVVKYSNGVQSRHGNMIGDSLQIGCESRTISAVQFGSHDLPSKPRGVAHFFFYGSDFKVYDHTVKNAQTPMANSIWSTAPRDPKTTWDIAGFYSSFDPKNGCFQALGLVWTSESPKSIDSLIPASVDLASFPSELRESLDKAKGLGRTYRISDMSGDRVTTENWGKTFNCLDPAFNLQTTSRIQDIEVFFNNFEDTWVLSAMRVIYAKEAGQDKPLTMAFGHLLKDHETDASYDPVTATNAVVKLQFNNLSAEKMRIIAAQVQTGRLGSHDVVVGVNFYQQREKDALWWQTTWAPDQKNGAKQASKRPTTGRSPVFYVPPDGGRWSVRGFYGQVGAVIDRLGVVLGRD